MTFPQDEQHEAPQEPECRDQHLQEADEHEEVIVALVSIPEQTWWGTRRRKSLILFRFEDIPLPIFLLHI